MNHSFRPDEILESSLPDIGCRGAVLAVSENRSISTYSAGSITEADHQRPYYIYSISKTFTAVAIMKLCEDQGDFLDRRLSDFLGGRPIPEAVTVRQLLNHTSGLSDYFCSAGYQASVRENPDKPWSYEKLMEAGLKNTPLFEAGHGWAYSNPGYGLLKELIELKAGTGYYDYLNEIIIGKIGLAETRPFLEPDRDLALLEGDDPGIDGDFRPRYHPGWIATGCLISTAGDVARFYDAVFDGTLLSEQSLAEMTRTVNVFPNPPEESVPSYGLGLMHSRNSPLGDAYGHGGGGPGYSTYALHYPQLGGNAVSISLVLNKSLAQTPFQLADDIVSHYLESERRAG